MRHQAALGAGSPTLSDRRGLALTADAHQLRHRHSEHVEDFAVDHDDSSRELSWTSPPPVAVLPAPPCIRGVKRRGVKRQGVNMTSVKRRGVKRRGVKRRGVKMRGVKMRGVKR